MEKWNINNYANAEAEEKAKRKEERRKKYVAEYEEIESEINIHITDTENNKHYIFIIDSDMKEMIKFLKKQGYFETIKGNYLQYECPQEIANTNYSIKYIQLHHLVINTKLFNAITTLEDLDRANIQRSNILKNFHIDHITEKKVNTRKITTYENELLPQNNNRYDNLVALYIKTNTNLKTNIIDKIIGNYAGIDHYNNKFYITYYSYIPFEFTPGDKTNIIMVEYDLPVAEELAEQINIQANEIHNIYIKHNQANERVSKCREAYLLAKNKSDKELKYWNYVLKIYYDLFNGCHLFYIDKQEEKKKFAELYLNKKPFFDKSTPGLIEIKKWNK